MPAAAKALPQIAAALLIVCGGAFLFDRFDVASWPGEVRAWSAQRSRDAGNDEYFGKAVALATERVGSAKTAFLSRACMPRDENYLPTAGEHAPVVADCIQTISEDMKVRGCASTLGRHAAIRAAYEIERGTGQSTFTCD